MRNWLIKLFFKLTKVLVYRHHYAPNKYRQGMDFFTGFLRSPKRVKYEDEKIDHIPALWIKPDNIDNDSVILYLHGGGYGMGSIKSHKKLAARIARSAKTQCLLIEYRLAPEHMFPCALDDSILVYKWLLNKGFKPEKIAMGGDSAGGGLTICTLLKLKELGMPQPLAAFCMSPWLDLSADSPEMEGYQKHDPFIDLKSVKLWGERYAGKDTRNPFCSPLYADASNISPLLIQIGTAEILLFENRNFYANGLKKGMDIQFEEYKDMVHVFQTFGGFLPQADKAIESIGRFILSKAQQKNSTVIESPKSAMA
jgi:monoterpene epsilon-lactone hydrolase